MNDKEQFITDLYGDFGTDTKRAVVFQTDHGLLKDGKFGRDTQAALHAAVQAKAAPGLDDKHNPDHTLYEQAYAGVRKIDADMGRPSDQHSVNLAAALTVTAKAQGLTRIDTVAISEDGSRTFAAQITSPFKTIANAPTTQAINTSVEQSGLVPQITHSVPASIHAQVPSSNQRKAPQQAGMTPFM